MIFILLNILGWILIEIGQNNEFSNAFYFVGLLIFIPEIVIVVCLILYQVQIFYQKQRN